VQGRTAPFRQTFLAHTTSNENEYRRVENYMKANGLAAIVAILCTVSIALSANAQSLEWSADDSAQLSGAVSSGRYGSVTSVWVEQGGNLLHAEYFRGAGADTRHNLRSVGKTVTGMLVGIAIADGHIDGVHEKAAAYFDDLPPFQNGDPRKDDISLQDLLTMSGPLECDDWNSFSRGNEERMYLVEDWSSFFWNLPVKNRPSWEIPETDGGFGRLFSYCTAGIQLVGEIVERAVGSPAPEYAERRLFGPTGIGSRKWNYASSGKAHLGGGLELATTDWASLARLYVNGGRADGRQVIPEAWVDASLEDYVRIDDETNYGYLWWRPRYEVDGREFRANMMSGSGGNRVYALPEFGVVVVLTKNDFRDRDAHQSADLFFLEQVVHRLRSRPGDDR
jgi:CubicO group peptidase (beta-lactamase class C family)